MKRQKIEKTKSWKDKKLKRQKVEEKKLPIFDQSGVLTKRPKREFHIVMSGQFCTLVISCDVFYRKYRLNMEYRTSTENIENIQQKTKTVKQRAK